MKFPLIWRSTLEREREQNRDIWEHDQRNAKVVRVMLTETRTDLKDLQSVLKMERARYDELIHTVVEMKKDGFEKPLFHDMEAEEVPDLSTEVWKAINEVANPGDQEYQDLVDYAVEAKKQGTPEGFVVGQIYHGQDVDE